MLLDRPTMAPMLSAPLRAGEQAKAPTFPGPGPATNEAGLLTSGKNGRKIRKKHRTSQHFGELSGGTLGSGQPGQAVLAIGSA